MKKLAIVHDGLATFGGRGGAEYVLAVLKTMFPDAPVYTTVYHKERMPDSFQHFDIRTSFIQRLPFGRTRYKAYLPFMPTAVEQFDLSEFDVVLSCNHSVAKGVVTSPGTRHVCYCYTPLRYAWDMYHEYLDTSWRSPVARRLIPPLLTYMRLWDALSSQRVDHFIAISRYVARRIRKYYRRDATVIHPPVDTSRFYRSAELSPNFLVVSRLEPYKRIDLAVRACSELQLPLVVIGDGGERKALMQMAGPTVTFLGRQPDEVVEQHLATCQALIFPGEEDFGITPVEAQAAGRPVIAYGGGGALETVLEGRTGMFFTEKTVASLSQAIANFQQCGFESGMIQQHARAFDQTVFERRIRKAIEKAHDQI